MNYGPGTKVFGDWEIIREIGEGAFGKVFEIHKTDYGITTRSALKVICIPRSDSDIKAALSEGMDPQSVSSYFQGFVDEIAKEIVIMSKLKSHPNIVAYEDHQILGHEGKIGWDILIRMELLTPLNDYRLNHAMNPSEILKLGRQICGALVYCQNKGLIHRDIKPENIFISETGQFKLGDFGVARTIEKTTGGLSKKGTEKYMAPEVFFGREYGASVDLYSLGLVLYSFLNLGRMPFYPLDTKQITYADREKALNKRMGGEKLPPPKDAGKDFAEVILKACAYAPEERYHAAEEMLQALRKVTVEKDGSPIDSDFAADAPGESKTEGMNGYPDAQDEEELTVVIDEGSDGSGDAANGTSHQHSEQQPQEEQPVKQKAGRKMLLGVAVFVTMEIAVLIFEIFVFFQNRDKGLVSPGYEDQGGSESKTIQDLLDSKEEELLSFVQNGIDQYNQNEIRGKRTEIESVYADRTEKSISIETLDESRQILMEQNEDGSGLCYYTKEGEQEFVYITSMVPELKIQIDENAPENMRYTYKRKKEEVPVQLSGALLNEERVLQDIFVEAVDEHEDGTVEIKIEVMYAPALTEEEMLKNYLQSLRDERGITEEDFELVPEGEETLKEYIRQLEKSYADTVEYRYWLTIDELRLVRSTVSIPYLQAEEYNEAYNKMAYVLAYLSVYNDQIYDGDSASEARRDAELYMNESYQPAEEDYMVQSIYNYTYLTGDACTPIGELPSDFYEEMTYTLCLSFVGDPAELVKRQ